MIKWSLIVPHQKKSQSRFDNINIEKNRHNDIENTKQELLFGNEGTAMDTGDDDMNMDDNNNNNVKPTTIGYAVNELPPDAIQEESIERVACPQCNRKFAVEALHKHTKICKKVFCQKRKAFDTTSQRMDEEALKSANNNDDKQAAIDAALKIKKEKWKNQSVSLREAIKAAKDVSQAIAEGKDISKLPIAKSSVPDTRTPCPYCGRKFSDDAAERHIPKCKNIQSRPKIGSNTGGVGGGAGTTQRSTGFMKK